MDMDEVLAELAVAVLEWEFTYGASVAPVVQAFFRARGSRS